jgi:hypothetical protein
MNRPAEVLGLQLRLSLLLLDEPSLLARGECIRILISQSIRPPLKRARNLLVAAACDHRLLPQLA